MVKSQQYKIELVTRPGCLVQVWPENDAFGKGDDAEEEFMEIRQILFADVPRPKHLAPEQEEDPSGGGGPGEEDNYDGGEDEDEEEEEDEEVVERYVSKEQEFDFKAFLGRFTVKSVCSAYGNLLQVRGRKTAILFRFFPDCRPNFRVQTPSLRLELDFFESETDSES